MDTAIVDTLLLTMRGDQLGIVDDGAVGIADGEITYVGPSDGIDETAADEVVDGDGCATLPGFVNAHTHMRHTLLRGGAQDVPEIEWMNRALGPLNGHVDDEDAVVGARLGAMETIRSGATTVCEYGTDVETLVESVYEPLGVRTVATETINEVPDDRSDLGPRDLYPFDREQGDAALSRAESLFDRYADDPLVTPMYGPQALDMVSLDLLHDIFDRCEEHDRDVHMHVAQGEREQLQIAVRYGSSTVDVLDDEGLLSERLLAAHLHGASESERRRLASAGVRMVGCPSSICAIDGIVPPIAEYRDHGGVVAVGTDQAPGPGGHNVLREVRTASMLSKADAADPTALPAWQALRLATVDGARALGVGDAVGSLEEGKRADVITVSLDTLGLAPTVADPFHTVVPNLVYASTGAEVRDVFVDGEAVVRDGAFTAIDEDAVVAEANDHAERVFAAATDDWRDADSALVRRADEGWL
jgi:5-methylthioadenosine/S-adenosylhomocysteine deaminase